MLDAVLESLTATEADRVIVSFGMAPTQNNLFCMAAEMERRINIRPRGPVATRALMTELRRRALAAAG